VKTAISVPDDTFAQVERCAGDLGVTRSEFYTRAARHYLDHLRAESLTQDINAALELAGADDSGHAAVAAGRHLLAADDRDEPEADW
jgi:metal-responsive CopG/Arc/MetJ family transcriptional regulator